MKLNLKEPLLDKAQIVSIALSSVNEILNQGLKYSTWKDEFPEAYEDLLRYREDLAISIAHTICDKLDIEHFDWPGM